MQADKDTTAELYAFPRLRPEPALAVIAQLSMAHGELEPSDLRLSIDATGWVRFYLPAIRGNKTDTKSFRESLISALQQTGGVTDIGRGANQAGSMSTKGLHPVQVGAVIVAAQTGGEPSLDPDIPDNLLIVSPTTDTGVAFVSSVMRQGRDTRLLVDGDKYVALYVADAAERYGGVSSLLGRADLPEGFVAMRGYSAGTSTLWLPLDLGTPTGPALAALGQALAAWSGDSGVSDRAYVPVSASQRVVLLLAAAKNALPNETTVAEHLEPLQLFDLKVMSLTPDKEAARKLTTIIAEHAHRIGYRVKLEPVPHYVGLGMDLEPLLEQIEDLKLRVAQIKALSAPQQRLLRFSDKQLPAMVDALRRLQPEALTQGHLFYAAGHSAGRQEPAHYLLYDPSNVHISFPESLWQSQTEDRPMVYWLEPFVADAQLQRPTRTRVFVPDRFLLAPSLAHFGGDVDGTLKMVMGNLFVDLGPLVSEPNRQPYFIFTPNRDVPGEMEVEVLDGARFAPVHQQLGWINDYLQVRGPNIVDRERLRIVAEELYEGAYVDELKKEFATTLADATAAWEEALNTLRAESASLLDAHAEELTLVTGRISKAQTYLTAAVREMTGLEALMSCAERALLGRDTIATVLSDQDAAIRAAGETFAEQIAREMQMGRERIDKSEAELQALHDRVERILGYR